MVGQASRLPCVVVVVKASSRPSDARCSRGGNGATVGSQVAAGGTQMTIPGQGERWTNAARGYLSRTTPVVPPIYQCTTFELNDDSYRDIVEGGGFGQTWYTRFGNPTVTWAADGVARLEGGQAAVMTSSGMGAIATTLLSLCRAGGRIVAARELYGDTRDLLVRDLPALWIRSTSSATTPTSSSTAAPTTCWSSRPTSRPCTASSPACRGGPSR
jgi:hypothetical protein